MIFSKSSHKAVLESDEPELVSATSQEMPDEVETVVGPSVNVEGDFASEGNIIVKGSVAGSVYTSKHLSVELGARIVANVRAGSSTIAGEVKGNIKVKESLELTSTAKVLGDIEAKVLTVEPGALIFGKISMPGIDVGEKPGRSGRLSKKAEEIAVIIED
jgi:cytoskeletal protein CcmA (bactofilin family)